MDTTTEAFDALSEALGPELRDWLHWLPCGLLALGTEIWTLRTGHAPATSLYRFVWSKPALRYTLIGWLLATVAHLHRIGPPRLDIYSLVDRNLVQYGRDAAHQARRDLERSRSA